VRNVSGLNVSGLTVTRGNRVVVDDMSFSVPRGSITAVLGPSGSGKTTLLRAIAGLLRVQAGTINVNDCDVTQLPAHLRGIGLMFQEGHLFPTMNVADNIAFGLRMQNKRKAERNARVQELLSLIHLPDYAKRDVTTLSGGESRRVALARAIAPSPPVLLLDEPLTGLEEDFRYALAQELSDILRATEITVVLVTHDRREAEIMADAILHLLPRGDGDNGAVFQ
jgi:ABC-type Fe3+/spermidine/putrescine transport system ATPase subunit